MVPQPLVISEVLATASRELRAGNFDAAEVLYRRVLEVEPAHHAAMHSLGVVGYRRKDYRTAIEWIERAIRIAPNESNYHNTLGACQRGAGNPEGALASYRRSLALQPDKVDVLGNMGNALRELGRHDEAIASYERSIALARTHAAHFGLANVLVEAGRPRDALAQYRAALALQPEHAETHFAYALALLMGGEFAAGWQEYEWRLESHARPQGVYRDFPQPKWEGEELHGRRILLHAEQGFGDALQFIRYAPLVAERGGRVIVECRPELQRLFARVPGIEIAVVRGAALPEFEVRCALLSLPLVFRTTLDTIPSRVPYLEADRTEATAWRERLAGDTGTKVGIAWSGSPTGPGNARKSVPYIQFASLAGIGNTLFYSLQKGPASSQAAAPAGGLQLRNWSAELRDFADTAALVANLDLVITVDTAVAHLAGAMGKPVWLLLSAEGDWRWLVGREDSPWYPTLRIFKQQRRGEWTEVFERVAVALEAL